MDGIGSLNHDEVARADAVDDVFADAAACRCQLDDEDITAGAAGELIGRRAADHRRFCGAALENRSDRCLPLEYEVVFCGGSIDRVELRSHFLQLCIGCKAGVAVVIPTFNADNGVFVTACRRADNESRSVAVERDAGRQIDAVILFGAVDVECNFICGVLLDRDFVFAAVGDREVFAAAAVFDNRRRREIKRAEPRAERNHVAVFVVVDVVAAGERVDDESYRPTGLCGAVKVVGGRPAAVRAAGDCAAAGTDRNYVVLPVTDNVDGVRGGSGVDCLYACRKRRGIERFAVRCTPGNDERLAVGRLRLRSVNAVNEAAAVGTLNGDGDIWFLVDGVFCFIRQGEDDIVFGDVIGDGADDACRSSRQHDLVTGAETCGVVSLGVGDDITAAGGFIAGKDENIIAGIAVELIRAGAAALNGAARAAQRNCRRLRAADDADLACFGGIDHRNFCRTESIAGIGCGAVFCSD